MREIEGNRPVSETDQDIRADARFPRIGRVGLDGLLVSFGETLSEPANRAALAFRAAVEQVTPEGVEESTTSLVSTFLRFDALRIEAADLRAEQRQHPRFGMIWVRLLARLSLIGPCHHGHRVSRWKGAIALSRRSTLMPMPKTCFKNSMIAGKSSGPEQ